MGVSVAATGAVLLGFDLPIGVPHAYAKKAGIASFVDALRDFGTGSWVDIFDPARARGDITIHRPFYPYRPGGTSLDHLTIALGLERAGLFRACDKAEHRPPACALFWTLGANQVGKGALAGWKELLRPAVVDHRDSVAVWPFDGQLAELIASGKTVIAETYPAEFYRQLRLPMSRRRQSRGKRVQSWRQEQADRLLEWADDAGVRLSDDLRGAITDGFGETVDGEDPFDATVGLFGMLNIVLGHHPPGDPPPGPRTDVEGWILGQPQPLTPAPTSPSHTGTT